MRVIVRIELSSTARTALVECLNDGPINRLVVIALCGVSWRTKLMQSFGVRESAALGPQPSQVRQRKADKQEHRRNLTLRLQKLRTKRHDYKGLGRRGTQNVAVVEIINHIAIECDQHEAKLQRKFSRGF